MSWVMELRGELLTLFFKVVTSLGGIVFLGLVMSSGYWLWRKALFRELILLYCLSGMLNNHLKETWQVPRPFQNPEAGVTALIHVSEGSLSFPSGHAQTAALLWGWLAFRLRRGWLYVAAAIIILLVASSRVYLGVHYPSDVVAGVGVGFGGLVLFQLARVIRARFFPAVLGGKAELLLLLSLILLWLLVFPGEKGPRYVLGYGGGLFGFWVGVIRDRGHRRSTTRTNLGALVGILLVGFGIPAALYLLLRDSVVAWRQEMTTLDLRALGYFAVTALAGAWISLGAPAIFQLAGWTDRRSSEETAGTRSSRPRDPYNPHS